MHDRKRIRAPGRERGDRAALLTLPPPDDGGDEDEGSSGDPNRPANVREAEKAIRKWNDDPMQDRTQLLSDMLKISNDPGVFLARYMPLMPEGLWSIASKAIVEFDESEAGDELKKVCADAEAAGAEARSNPSMCFCGQGAGEC